MSTAVQVVYTITEEPIYNANGVEVGKDRIRRPTTPIAPDVVAPGCVKVFCSCGIIHLDVPQATWDAWGKASHNLPNGACACKTFFAS